MTALKIMDLCTGTALATLVEHNTAHMTYIITPLHAAELNSEEKGRYLCGTTPNTGETPSRHCPEKNCLPPASVRSMGTGVNDSARQQQQHKVAAHTTHNN